MPNVFIFSNPIKEINPNKFKNSFVIELKKDPNDQYQYFEDVENKIYYHKNFKSVDLPDLLNLIDINTLYSDEHNPDLQGLFNYQILEEDKKIEIKAEEQYFVSYCDEKFEPVIQCLVESLNEFSTRKVIVYSVNFDISFDYPNLIKRRYNSTNKDVIWLNPSIILQAFKDGVNEGIFLDADQVVNYNVDDLWEYQKRTNEYPLVEEGFWFHSILNGKPNPNLTLLEKYNALDKVQKIPYLQTNLFTFNLKNKDVIKEWEKMCLDETNHFLCKQEHFIKEETLLNVLYRMKGFTDYIPLSLVNVMTEGDIRFLLETFYPNVDNYIKPGGRYFPTKDEVSNTYTAFPYNKNDIKTYHNSKDPIELKKFLEIAKKEKIKHDEYMNIIEILEKSISDAEQGISKLPKEILELQGMSSNKNRHFLNNLLSLHQNPKYLEVGVWKGSTFISANYDNTTTKSVAVDNFSEFLNGAEAQEMTDNFNSKISRYIQNKNVEFIESDYKNVDFSRFEKFNIYFYDGNHSEEEQYNAFKYLDSYLEDRFICIVDDWNWDDVKNGTRRIFSEYGYKIVWEKELPAGYNGDLEGWWNGLYVAYIEKPNLNPRNLDKYRVIDLESDEWKSEEFPTANKLNGLKDLLDFYHINKNHVACEIGSFAGVSSELIAQYTRWLYCVDIWDEYIFPKERANVVEGMFDQMIIRNPNITKIKKSSEVASSEFNNDSLDFVYIDADHSYESVKKDISYWLPKVKEGGILAGHDYFMDEVKQAVNENFDKVKTFQDSSWSLIVTKEIKDRLVFKPFTIIIPTYNRTKYLKRAIDSVLSQNYPNVNILVCHDGESEDYNKFAESNSYPNVNYYFNDKNYNDLGAYSRNRMLSLTPDINYVIFLDDDNILFENSLIELNQSIKTNDKMIISKILLDGWGEKNLILPKTNNIICSEIDSLNVCISAKIAKLIGWDDIDRGHDFRFMQNCEKYCLENNYNIKYTELVIGRHYDNTNLDRITEDIVVVSAHPKTKSSEEITLKCIKAIKKSGKKVILTSHVPISEKLQEISDYCIYDKNNPITTHDFYTNAWYRTQEYQVEINLTKNENNTYHGIGCLINYYNGILLAKSLGFTISHCINFDIILNEKDYHILDDITTNLKRSNKLGYFIHSKENEGETLKTVFFTINPTYFLDNFKYPHSETEYLDFVKQRRSESNGLENYFYNNLKYKLDDLILETRTENQLFSSSAVNISSEVEYFTILPMENKFAVWFSTSNTIDNRWMKISVFENNSLIFSTNQEITTISRFYKILEFNPNKIYKVRCEIINDQGEFLKDKTIRFSNFSDIKDNGKFIETKIDIDKFHILKSKNNSNLYNRFDLSYSDPLEIVSQVEIWKKNEKVYELPFKLDLSIWVELSTEILTDDLTFKMYHNNVLLGEKNVQIIEDLKIKAIHLKNLPDTEREIKSTESITISLKDKIEYVEIVNEPYRKTPPTENCRRPEAVADKPGYFLLGPGHYGCYLAHREGIEQNFTEDLDALLVFEGDAKILNNETFIEDVHKAYNICVQKDLLFWTFGPDTGFNAIEEYQEYKIINDQVLLHAYLIPNKSRQKFLEMFNTEPWDVTDILYHKVFTDEKIGIFKKIVSKQLIGPTLIDYIDTFSDDGTDTKS